MVTIVKRKGHKEKFDEKKAYASIYAACASADYNEQTCERIAKEITRRIKRQILGRKEIASTALRKKIEGELKKRNKELAFYYEQHLPNLNKL